MADEEFAILREDLVYEYARGRSLVWIWWGERELYPFPWEPADWYQTARQEHANVWRHVKTADELSSLFGSA